MVMQKVVVAGGGVLGSQIAFQCAYCGLDTTIWLRSEGSIGRTKPKLDQIHAQYIEAINLMDTPEGKSPTVWCMGIADPDSFDKQACLDATERAFSSVKLELDLAAAVRGADIVVEAMAEDPDAKTAFYKKLAPLMDEKTILVTNSSSLLPSRFAKDTGRPDRYLALHFANSIWKHNTAEIMAQDQTSQESFDAVMAFARQIRMLALPVKKEKAGYLLNSMLIPFLLSGLDLYATGVSDPRSIDIAWTHGTGAPKGPFQIVDTVGLTTAENIVKMFLHVPSFLAPYHFKDIDRMLNYMIDRGRLGVASGQGFYTYDKDGTILDGPDPA